VTRGDASGGRRDKGERREENRGKEKG